MAITKTMTVVSVLTLLIVGFVQVDASAVSWNYDNSSIGPSNWSAAYPDCAGKMQSPINIIPGDALYDPKLEHFNLSDYATTKGVNMTLSNKGGHTVEVEYEGTPIFLRGGNLPDDYQLLQFHFHWGAKDEQGSEHLMNGNHFPMELHIVHKQAHIDKANASSHPYGLAVLGFLFNVTQTNNTKFDQLLKHFDEVQLYDPNSNKTDNKTEIETFSILDLLPGDTSKLDFYRYFGSLTTPPCSESVIWSVATELIEISEYQLNIFRNLHNDEDKPLVNDFRPTQELHYRRVTTTKMPVMPEPPTTQPTKTCNNAPALVSHQLGVFSVFIVALYLTLI